MAVNQELATLSAAVIEAARRFKKTAKQKAQSKRNAKNRKKYTKVTQQPKKSRGAYVGRVSFVWASGPNKGKTGSVMVTLKEPGAKLSIAAGGQAVKVKPKNGEAYLWGSKKPKAKKPAVKINKAETPGLKPVKLAANTGEKCGPECPCSTECPCKDGLEVAAAKCSHAAMVEDVVENLEGAEISSALDDGSTLEQLIGLEVESLLSGTGFEGKFKNLLSGNLDVPPAVKKAAADYEKAAEALLREHFSEAAVDEAMGRDAPFLMFLTQEGHGRGVSDGDLNIDDLDVKKLRSLLNTNLGYENKMLSQALTAAGGAVLGEAIDDLVVQANEKIEKDLEQAAEYEATDERAADYFPDGIGDAIAYQFGSLQKFAERELNDRYMGDLAEVVAAALAQGRDEDEIREAMERVGEYRYVGGYGAMKNAIATSGQIGEVESQIDIGDMYLDSDYGDDVSVADVVEIMKSDLSEITMEKLGDWAKRAKGNEVLAYQSVDGYAAFVVDPSELAKDLEVDMSVKSED